MNRYNGPKQKTIQKELDVKKQYQEETDKEFEKFKTHQTKWNLTKTGPPSKLRRPQYVEKTSSVQISREQDGEVRKYKSKLKEGKIFTNKKRTR